MVPTVHSGSDATDPSAATWICPRVTSPCAELPETDDIWQIVNGSQVTYTLCFFSGASPRSRSESTTEVGNADLTATHTSAPATRLLEQH